MVLSYNEVKETFENQNCELSMTEEEFNLKKPRKVNEKYKYIASCKHNHEVCFERFKNRSQGIICPKCVRLKISINQIEKYKLNPLLSNFDLEYDSIEYLKTIIGDSFYVKKNGENCLSDCCIKPKHITEDLWLMVQMKSTKKTTGKTSKNGKNGSYVFDCHSKYINCIIVCICASDRKMWVFDGNTITTKSISIGSTKSQNDKFEITKETIYDKVTNYYNTFPKYDFETTDIPITKKYQLEREYRIYRETMIACLPFIRNERQALVYDFTVNGFKVQEKVKSQRKNGKDTTFKLDKSNGVKKIISYQKGDNDLYWLNVNNKQHFYIIPEHELLIRNIINIDKTTSINLNPHSTNNKHYWANEYLFDYTNLTEIDIQRLKTMFNL